MINNWELSNRIDHATGTIHYFLLTDGTEQDARLLARKLQGYVTGISPAAAPHIYQFDLPCDMDEGTQDKLRTAIEEGVALSNKVNAFIPGGTLGSPLFSANITPQGEKAAPNSSGGFSDTPADEEPVKQIELDLESNTPLNLANTAEIQVSRVALTEEPEQATVTPVTAEQPQEHTDITKQQTPPPAPKKSTISISDQDMLLKDMENSVLGKMPLENILSADTKLDMFVDVSPAAKKETKAPAAVSYGKETPPPADKMFNVFEPETTDTDNLLDVEEIHTITDKITQKNMDFMNDPKIPGGEPHIPSVPQEGADTQAQAFAVPPAPQADPSAAGLSSVGTPTDVNPAHKAISSSGLPPETPLPEITIRQPQPQAPEQNPVSDNISTTPAQPANPVNRPAMPSAPTPARPAAQPAPQKPVLRLRKPAVPPAPQEPGKTVLHLRRKETPAAPAPAPTPAPQAQIAQPLHSTMSPQRAAENLRLAKTKAIDHSIEIPISELKKHNWPLEIPLVPTYTMNNMVMSVNRFAHATAVSVIENPGKLYNPLVLHGGTGTGKTHFLNALAYAFSQKFGQEHIFMTNGVRLSRGIQRYVMEGNIAKFEEFMESVKVLLIDDIHLAAINEQNKSSVSKLLNSFLRNQKQIVITSKYPPESLSKLEELINFRLDAGWISELKPATGATHFRIVKKMLIESGVDLNDKQIEEFFGGSHMTLGTVTRSIRRLKVLENLIFKNLEQDTKSQAGIFEKLLATKGEDPSSELATKDPDEVTNIVPTGNGEWGRIGIFYPQNCSNMMSWIVYALGQRAKELGISGGFDIVVRSSYATENIISSAFKIANLCDNKKLKGAIILGPQTTACDPSVRENFYDILTHMLEIMLIRCGIINYENVRLPSTYVKLISELMR